MACTAGLAVLEVIEKEGLQQNAKGVFKLKFKMNSWLKNNNFYFFIPKKDVGTYFLKSLNQLMDVHEVIGDVRGQVSLKPFDFRIRLLLSNTLPHFHRLNFKL